MLRILRAMQFSVLLMVQAPERMAVSARSLNRFSLAQWRPSRTCANRAKRIGATRSAIDRTSRRDCEGINPEAIAGDDQREPPTAVRPIDDSGDGRGACGCRRADKQGRSRVRACREHAWRLVPRCGGRGPPSDWQSRIDELARNKQHQARREDLLRIFHQEYRWSLYALLSLAVVIGIGLGMLLQRWLETPAQQVDRAPMVQSAPSIKPRIKP